MGLSIQGSGATGKKSLDAELNLIPFIDLLICCICFLLITAVWSQLAHIRVSQHSPGQTEQLTRPPPRVAVLVGEDGYALTVGSQRVVIARKGVHYDTARLSSTLRRVQTRLSGTPPLTVAAEDGIPYRQLIRVLDLARQADFGAINVRDAATTL